MFHGREKQRCEMLTKKSFVSFEPKEYRTEQTGKSTDLSIDDGDGAKKIKL